MVAFYSYNQDDWKLIHGKDLTDIVVKVREDAVKQDRDKFWIRFPAVDKARCYVLKPSKIFEGQKIAFRFPIDDEAF